MKKKLNQNNDLPKEEKIRVFSSDNTASQQALNALNTIQQKSSTTNTAQKKEK